MATATKTKTTETTMAGAAPNNLPAQQQPKQPPLIVQFRDYVQQRMATLEDALPPTIPPKRFVSVVMTALQNKPKLLECTFASLWNSCVRAAQDGLLPDGREGAIAPYGENKEGKRVAEIATWMPMVEGYRKKAFEAGHVHAWEVNVVYEKDDFDFELGDNAFIKHRPYIGPEPSGGIVGAYSRAKLANGEVVREVMSAYQIMQVKAKSKAGNGPWQDQAFFPEMCKKVVARRHYKQLPHSESMDAMIARDDAEHGLLDRDDTPPIARVERRAISSRDVMDQYAGETIDHETGEITDTSDAAASPVASEAGAAQAQANTDAAPSNNKASATKAATAKAKEDASAAAAAASSAASAQEGNTSAGGKEAADPKATTETAASNQSTEDAGNSPDTDEMPEDDEQVDGADRPWPPGTLPTDKGEYTRYLKTELAKQTKASEVAPWFNSAEQKELRLKCECAAIFKELQDLAIARRKELT